MDFYALCNPHATFRVQEPGRSLTVIRRTTTAWTKWSLSAPTSPHWYTPARLETLIAGYVAAELDGGRPRTVREFVTEFAGLSGSSKQRDVTMAAGLSGAWLRDLAAGGAIDRDACGRLLAAMQEVARPIKPAGLGVVGEEHLRATLVTTFGAAPESVRVKKVELVADGIPYVLEVGFGIHGEHCAARARDVAIAVNWSPAIAMPIPHLTTVLGENRLDVHDPVSLVVHLACPRLEYIDRGKTQLALPAVVMSALADAVTSVTKGWKQAKRQADRDDHVRQRDLDELRRSQRRQEWTIKDAAWSVMERAYRHAAGHAGMAHARQIMYAARPLVLELTGGRVWKNDAQFTQNLLPDFIDEYPDPTADWDVVYDARGHLVEPHTGRRVPLGTVEVREYIAAWKGSAGPANRYAFALFVEKEGFSPLLDRAGIAERFDVAIMSTKGMSVTAARLLVDHLSQRDVTILVVRDFDKSGFTIARTIAQDGRRYRYSAPPKVVDLGLRLTDVEAMGLSSEPVEYTGDSDPRVELRRSGATPDECGFLVRRRPYSGWAGERVELNAMTSDQFIDWIERKLTDAGVHKVVPASETLEATYRTTVQDAKRQAVIDAATKKALEGFVSEPVDVPPDLHARVEAALPLGRVETWEDVVRGYARNATATG